MKKRISAVITLIFFVLAAMAQVIPNGVYVIKYTESPSYVLTMKDNKTTDGNQVVVNEWQNKTSQMWEVENLAGGAIILRSVANKKLVINSKNNRLANDALIVTSSYTGINRQKWVPEQHSNGSYVLMMSENKNFCLELKDGTVNAKNNGTVELWSTHKCNHQQWTFENVESSSTPDSNSTSTSTSPTTTKPTDSNSGSTNTTTKPTDNNSGSTSTSSSTQHEGNVYIIKSAGDPNFVISIDGKPSNHKRLVIQKNRKADAQKWRLTHEKDDTYALRSLLDENFVISINDQLRGFLWLSEFKGSDLERWKAVKMQNGNYMLLLSKDQNRAIDIEGATYEENRGLQIYGRHNDLNQQWIMERVDGDNNSGTTTTTTKPTDNNSGSTNTTTKPADNNSGSTNTTTKPTDNNSGSTSTTSTSPKEGNVYIIKSAGDPNFVISIDGKPSNHKRLEIQKNRKADAQKWKLTHEKDDTYALRSILDENFVISINDQLRGFLWLSEFKGSDLERWKAVKMQNGNYMLLLSKDQNRAIDIEAAKYEENRGLQIYGRHNDLNQQWIMERVDGTSSSTSTSTSSSSSSSTSTSTSTSSSTVPDAPDDLTPYSDKIGQRFTFYVKARHDGKIWGGKDKIYTINSDLATASLHCDAQVDGNVDKVVIEIVADQGSYPSITRNGIKSQSYKKAKAAFKIIGVPVTEVTDPDISKYRDKRGEMVKVRVTGRNTGTIWGMNSGWGYMDKSDLATAAVHGGKLQPGQTGTLLVRVKGPSEKHEAATYNGIQSRSYGKSDGSFKIRSCIDATPIDHSSTSSTKPTNNNSGSTNTTTTPTGNNSGSTNSTSSSKHEGNVYYIKSAGDPNFVISIDGKPSNQKRLVIQKNRKADAQKWRLTHEKDDTYALRSILDENYVISINDQMRGFLWLSEFKGSDLERWKAVKMQNGNYMLLLSKDQNRAIDIEAAKYEENRGLQIYGRHNDLNQQWIMERVDGTSSTTSTTNTTTKPTGNNSGSTNTTTKPSNNNSGSTNTTTKPSNSNSGSTSSTSSTQHEGNIYIIKTSGDPNFVITVDGKPSNHKRLVIQKNRKADAQKWRLTREKDGSYILRSLLDENFVISINDQLRGFLWLSEYKGSDLERWKAVKMDNGNYVLLLTKDQERAIDVEAATYEENRGVQLYGRHDGPNQQWILERVNK